MRTRHVNRGEGALQAEGQERDLSVVCGVAAQGLLGRTGWGETGECGLAWGVGEFGLLPW